MRIHLDALGIGKLGDNLLAPSEMENRRFHIDLFDI